MHGTAAQHSCFGKSNVSKVLISVAILPGVAPASTTPSQPQAARRRAIQRRCIRLAANDTNTNIRSNSFTLLVARSRTPKGRHQGDQRRVVSEVLRDACRSGAGKPYASGNQFLLDAVKRNRKAGWATTPRVRQRSHRAGTATMPRSPPDRAQRGDGRDLSWSATATRASNVHSARLLPMALPHPRGHARARRGGRSGARCGVLAGRQAHTQQPEKTYDRANFWK